MFRDFFIFRENYGQKGIFRQSIRSMTAGQCLTERSFPTVKNGRISENHIIRADYWRGISAVRREWNVKTRASYARGELSGTYETYGEDGSYLKMEYQAGKPIHDYYLLADDEGALIQGPYCGRYDDMGITGHNGTIGRLPGRCAPGKSISKTVDNRADGCHCPGITVGGTGSIVVISIIH